MEPLQPNTVDASKEKHVPVVKRENGKLIVEVGSVAHPMTAEHHIEWIAIVGEDYTQRVSLKPGDEPKVIVCDMGEAKVYAYCNLHGLWMA
ncbi:Desulfoferrodoxin [bioreactor metagenome]|uniref:Desulfoferrodoxin n=1 Tax=bioreactor metagenome TaxID=1076179 RepID=A0A645ETR2_9ZZZZ